MLRRPRNRVLALVAVIGLLLIGGWVTLRPRTAAVLDDNRVAVAPFDVLGSGTELDLWREGLVDVLSRSLDGAGPLRTVSPTLVVRKWSGRADATSAQALGRASGSRTVVFGGLVRAGSDSVRLTATVLDVPGPNVLGEIELRESNDRMDRLADSLTVRVLRELGRTRAIGLVRSASLGSRSVPALKAFLQGEQFLRRSEWDSSLAYHQRAIALDSGFTLAWSHAGLAAGWQHADDSLSRAYKLRAGALNTGLAPRESLIVQSESLAAVVLSGPTQLGGRWWTYARRLISTLEEAVRRYPNDPELWYMLGDARYHASGAAGSAPRAALDAFDRSIALDSAFTPSYVHAIQLGLEFDDSSAGRRYARAFLDAGAMGRYARSSALVLDLLDRRARPGAIAFLGDSADEHLFQIVWIAVNRWLDSAETATALMRARLAVEQKAGNLSNRAVVVVPFALAARGHIKEASEKTTLPTLLAQLALVGRFTPDSAARLARSWIQRPGDGLMVASPLLAAVRDTAGIRDILHRIDSVRARPLPPNFPPIARDVIGYMHAAARAYAALARGDSAEALRLFDARPDTACFGACMIDDVVHVQLLAARNRLADAAARLERPLGGFTPGYTLMEVLRGLERGRVNERLGNRERAIAGYSLVVRAWRNADPELQPYVSEARRALERLNAEQQRTGS